MKASGWMIREYLNQGTAPFVLIDNNANPQSVAHIPDAGYTYIGRFRSEALAEATLQSLLWT